MYIYDIFFPIQSYVIQIRSSVIFLVLDFMQSLYFYFFTMLNVFYIVQLITFTYMLFGYLLFQALHEFN